MMSSLKSKRILQAGIWSTLLMGACSAAHADGPCSDQAVKDFFIQGGEQVIDGRNVKIRSLSNEETLAQSETSLSCRYLMELSDSSKRWVRFTYSLDATGQASIDYDEETTSTAR